MHAVVATLNLRDPFPAQYAPRINGFWAHRGTKPAVDRAEPITLGSRLGCARREGLGMVGGNGLGSAQEADPTRRTTTMSMAMVMHEQGPPEVMRWQEWPVADPVTE